MGRLGEDGGGRGRTVEVGPVCDAASTNLHQLPPTSTDLPPVRGENCILDPMPDEAPKRLIVVGDRVLIAPEEGEERTNVGLYLPPTAVESRQVLDRTGRAPGRSARAQGERRHPEGTAEGLERGA